MKVIFSPAARENLLDIWRYGARTWSPAQADKYYLGFVDAVERLPENPRAAARVEGTEYRRLLFRAHAAYYLIDGDVIVVCILHQSAEAKGKM